MTRVVAAAFAALLCGACGYIGEPLPPSLHLPKPVRDLAAVQRGSRIAITFTPPILTTDGLPVRNIPDFELWIGPAASPFNLNQWAKSSLRVTADSAGAFSIDSNGFIGKSVALALRASNRTGQDAGWSNFVQLAIVSPVPRPEHVQATATAGGVRLTWDPSAALLFRIFRGAAITETVQLDEVTGSSYTDISAEFGKPYTYVVKAHQGDAESVPSDPVSLTPKDIFPPSIPAHLSAIVGTKSIELSWDRNTEADFSYYRVFRREGVGSFTVIADHQPTPGFSDRNAKPATKYSYRVTAVDEGGNESDPSAPVEASLP